MQQPQVVYIGGVQGQAGVPQTLFLQGNPQQHQQQPQVVYINTAVPTTTQSGPVQYPSYKKVSAKVLGALQMAIGVLCIIMNVGLAVVNYNYVWAVASGWWATPFFIIGGSFGIGSANRPTKCLVVTTMVLSIISLVCVVGVVTQASLGLAVGCYYDYWDYNYYCWNDDSARAAHYAMTSLFLLFGLTEFAVALAQSIFCCQAVCCGSQTNTYGTPSGGQLGYYNAGFIPGLPQQSIPATNNVYTASPGAYNNATLTTVEGATAAATPTQPPAYEATQTK